MADRLPKPPGLKRLISWVIAALISFEALTVILLQIVSKLRKLGRPQTRFPHRDLPPVCVGDNRLRVYAYGEDLYQAMLAAIEQARESIYLETFLWKADAVGQRFKEALIRRAKEGVETYVVFDRFGNTVVPADFKVFPAPVHALAYQPIRRPWEVLDARRYALEHRKLLVVDGQVGFLGGYNLGAIYATQWRDTHLSLEGPAVADLAQEFVDFWNRHAQRDLISRRYPRRFDPLVHVLGTNALRLTFPIRNMYISAIDTAEDSIRLSNAYFIPDPALFAALKSAAERGVDVRILVPWVSNHVVVDWISRGYFSECLDVGIRVFAYRGMLHAKTCTIDGAWSTIGTANLDRLSSVGNYEVNVEIYSEELAAQMEELFDCDATNAFELTQERWQRRPWYAMLGERIVAPLRAVL